MPDKLSKAERSWLMSRVTGTNTKPERLVRSLLHRLGYRFTINGPKNKKLPGRPDIVLPSKRSVVFVHGCFWHRHQNCKSATTPKSNVDYWKAKFKRNLERDRDAQTALQDQGWQVVVIWECELKNLDSVAARILSEIPRSDGIEPPEEIEDRQLVAEARSVYRVRAKSSPSA